MVQGDVAGWRAGCGAEVRGNDAGLTPACTGALEPGQQLIRVADSGREPNALDWMSGKTLKTFKDSEEVPSAVVPRKRVDLVHDDALHVGEVLPGVDLGG